MAIIILQNVAPYPQRYINFPCEIWLPMGVNCQIMAEHHYKALQLASINISQPDQLILREARPVSVDQKAGH